KRSPITSSSGRSKYFSDCDTTRSSLFKCGFYYFRVCSHLPAFQTPHFFQSNNVWVDPFHPLKLLFVVLLALHLQLSPGLRCVFLDSSLSPTVDQHSFHQALYSAESYSHF